MTLKSQRNLISVKRGISNMKLFNQTPLETDSDYSPKKKKCKQRKIPKRKIKNIRKNGEDSPKVKVK